MNERMLLQKLVTGTQYSDWKRVLAIVLDSTDYQPKSGNPEGCVASFAIGITEIRVKSVERSGRELVGANQLLVELTRLPELEPLHFYTLDNERYAGTCYVKGEALLGCVFVERNNKNSIAVPENWDGDLNGLLKRHDEQQGR